MTNAFRVLRPVFLVAVALAAAACASTSGGPPAKFGPGQTVEFGGTAYQLHQDDQDFVLMRHREPTGEAGAISGFVDEVFRVSRHRLGEGRWTDPVRAPGVALQWRGLDTFSLARADDPVTTAPVEAGSEVVQATPAPTGQ